MDISRKANAKAESDTADRARAWVQDKAREKAEIARIDAKDKEKVYPEAKMTVREKEKAISAKRVMLEAGAGNWVRVDAKVEVRDQYVGILTDVLNKFRGASNGLKRAMVGSEKETKKKAEKSRAEVEV